MPVRPVLGIWHRFRPTFRTFSSAVTSNGVLFLTHPTMCEHLRETKHPDQPIRLETIIQAVEKAAPTIPGLHWAEPSPAERSTIERVHHKALVDLFEKHAGAFWIGHNIITTAKSCEAAFLAAGAAVEAVQKVCATPAQVTEVGVVYGTSLATGPLPRAAFAAVRPPGSHASAHTYEQWCMLNNVAIAVQDALDSKLVSKVLIVDTGVCHGFGTQRIFAENPNVLCFSVHSFGDYVYPGTGNVEEIGTGEGTGFTVNIPLALGAGDADYVKAFNAVLVPIAEQFVPDLIVVSAGFGAHHEDPYGGMNVTDAGFANMFTTLAALAGRLCDGRIAAVLEDGCSLPALSRCVPSCLRVLSEGGTTPPPPITRDPMPSTLGVLERVKRVHGKRWKL